MLREEAIELLFDIQTDAVYNVLSDEKEALDMAIKALEQQPCEDCINRAEAIKETKKLLRGNYDHEYIIETLKMLPSVTPDVLDKIRERISLEKIGYPPSAEYYKAIVKVLQIIDKYKTETKIEQGLNYSDQDTMMPAT